MQVVYARPRTEAVETHYVARIQQRKKLDCLVECVCEVERRVKIKKLLCATKHLAGGAAVADQTLEGEIGYGFWRWERR